MTRGVWPQRIEHALKAKQDISPDQLADLRREYERIQFDFISKVMVDAPSIYAKYFTAAELHELLFFYRTPIGAKSLRLMPQIAGKSMALVLPRIQQLQMEVMEAFAKAAEAGVARLDPAQDTDAAVHLDRNPHWLDDRGDDSLALG